MSGPEDAVINADGFRMYNWAGGDTPLNRKYNAVEPMMVLSVTSIRSLVGENYNLVRWKQANLVDAATGMRKKTVVGPRGGVKEVRVKDEFPGAFMRKMLETNGEDVKLQEVRKYLQETADEPRNIAANRGSIVHRCIELNTPARRITPSLVDRRFEELGRRDKERVNGTTKEDVNFVRACMYQYEGMREQVPFVILAQEPQVFSMKAGYAGSADVLIWWLGEWTEDGTFIPLPGVGPEEVRKHQLLADEKSVTMDTIREVGGHVALGDWKTSKDIYTDHVVQATAYLSADFVAVAGVIDERLTEFLLAAHHAVLVHIRPGGCELAFFKWREDVTLGFLGSVQFARLLALYPKAHLLFDHTISTAVEVPE